MMGKRKHRGAAALRPLFAGAFVLSALLTSAVHAHSGATLDDHKREVREAARVLNQHLRESRDEMDFAKDGLELARWRAERELSHVRARLVNNQDLCERGLLERRAGELEAEIKTCDEVLREDERAERRTIRSGRADVREAMEKLRETKQKWRPVLKDDRERLARARRRLDRHATEG